MSGCSRFRRCSTRRQGDVAAEPIHRRRGDQRQERQRDQRAQHAGDYWQTEQVERNVAVEKRVGATERHTVHPFEECQPPGRQRNSRQKGEEQCRGKKETGDGSRDVDVHAVAAVDVQHREAGSRSARQSHVAIEIGEGECHTEKKETDSPDQRGREDSAKADLLEPQPVGHESREPRNADEEEEKRRNQ